MVLVVKSKRSPRDQKPPQKTKTEIRIQVKEKAAKTSGIRAIHRLKFKIILKTNEDFYMLEMCCFLLHIISFLFYQ